MRILPYIISILLFQNLAYPAQEKSEQETLAEQGLSLLQQSNYTGAEEFFRLWVEKDKSDANAHYNLAISRAMQGKLDLALAGLRTALTIDPRMADAYFEIAGIYLKKNEYPEAFSYVKKGLRFSPANEYGLDLAGTLAFLMGSKVEAIGFWNKINRPYLTELRISSSAPLNRQLIADEINLKPGSLLSHCEIIKARWRLQQHAHIRAVSFTPVPGSEASKYALDVFVDSRKGFGTPMELIANALSSVGFQTFRLTYWNAGNSGLTFDMRTRLKSNARLAEFSVRAPKPGHLGIYIEASYAWRDESWNLNFSSEKSTEVHRLRSHEVSAIALVPIYEPRFFLGVGFSVRRRLQQSPASSLPTQVVSPAASQNWQYISWIRLSPNLSLLDRQAIKGYGWSSHLRANIDIGRAGEIGMHRMSRLSMSWENRLDRISKGEMQSTVQLGIHAGRLSRASALEDYFRLGVGPDAGFQLRAHPLFRNGMFGSTPLAGEFLLGNLTVGQDLFTAKFLRLGIVGFCDSAQMPRAYSGQKQSSSALDAGAGIEFGILGLQGPRFTLTYGRNIREHRNAFYLSASFR